MRVLLIEDDPMIGRGLVTALQQHAMNVDWSTNGEDGCNALLSAKYQIVLLDIGLPGMDGLKVLKHMRQSGDLTPLLILTARDGLEDRITGLDLGADDYLVKPFEIRELIARIHAVFRRRNGFAQSTVQAGEITIDLASHEVTYRGRTILLPAREFAVMLALTERPGSIQSRAQLEDRLYTWGNEIESNAIDVLIHSIRRKFDKEIIRNVRGAGWMVLKSTS